MAEDPHWWRAEFERQLQEVLASGWGRVIVEISRRDVQAVTHEIRRLKSDITPTEEKG